MKAVCRIEDLEAKFAKDAEDAPGRSRVECIPNVAGRQPGDKDGGNKSTATSSTNAPAANKARSASTFISNKLELGATLPQFVVGNTKPLSIDGPANYGLAPPYSSPLQTNSREAAYRSDENHHRGRKEVLVAGLASAEISAAKSRLHRPQALLRHVYAVCVEIACLSQCHGGVDPNSPRKAGVITNFTAIESTTHIYVHVHVLVHCKTARA